MNLGSPPLAWLKPIQRPVTDLPAHQPQGRAANGGGHAPYLSVSTFVYGESQPAIRYRFA
jgi:hypothetical protein